MAIKTDSEIAAEVRKVSGYTERKTISDGDLETIVAFATRDVLKEIYQEHYKEEVVNEMGLEPLIDGSNKKFYVKNIPIADTNGDGNVNSSDISAIWVNEDYDYETAVVVVSDATRGKLEITQDGGVDAIPSSAVNILVDYYTAYKNVNENFIDDARIFLSCHFVQLRVDEPDKISLHDLESNRQIIQLMPTRFYVVYKDKIRQVSRPKMRAG